MQTRSGEWIADGEGYEEGVQRTANFPERTRTAYRKLGETAKKK